MKYCTLALLFFDITGFSQEISVVKAIQENDMDYFMEEPDENDKIISYFMAGCNWYCGGGIQKVIASSQLKASGSNTYEAKNAHDFDKNTAWIEGKEDYGIGESLEYTFNFDQLENYVGKLGIHSIIIGNGYKKSIETWKNNSRVKQLKMYINGIPFKTINVLDSFEIQKATFETIYFPAGKNTTVAFEITDIYPGEKYKDTAISILVFDGVGVH